MKLLLSIFLSVVVSAQMDSVAIALGDQTTLHLEAVASAGEQVGLPTLGEQLTNDLLIVEKSKIDTTLQKDGRTTYSQDVVLTSFKDSLFYVEPLAFTVNGDTVRSASLTLNVVQPFEMDTTNAITDIKPVMRAKIWWWGIIRWLLLGMLIAALIVAAIILGIWLYKRAKKEPEPVINPELLRPCDEVALEKLDAIKEQKIWQQGEHKRYFSELTFVVREYISRRYNVQSTEKTSDDTLAAMRPILNANDQKELYLQLEKMLRLADLVKFAKWQPTPDEEELSLRQAYNFVNETKPTEEERQKNADASDNDFITIE